MELKTLKIDSDLHEKLKSLADTKKTSIQNLVEDKLSEMVLHEDDIMFSINKSVYNTEKNVYELEFTESSYKKLITFFEIFLTNRNLKNVNEIENLLKIISEMKGVKPIKEETGCFDDNDMDVEYKKLQENVMKYFLSRNKTFYENVKINEQNAIINTPNINDMISDIKKKEKDVYEKCQKIISEAYGDGETIEASVDENTTLLEKDKKLKDDISKKPRNNGEDFFKLATEKFHKNLGKLLNSGSIETSEGLVYGGYKTLEELEKEKENKTYLIFDKSMEEVDFFNRITIEEEERLIVEIQNKRNELEKNNIIENAKKIFGNKIYDKLSKMDDECSLLFNKKIKLCNNMIDLKYTLINHVRYAQREETLDIIDTLDIVLSKDILLGDITFLEDIYSKALKYAEINHIISVE